MSRAVLGVAVAAALTLFASGLRADEYNKLTYLTFSGPVQVPGVVLEGGTYMFKLADPEGSRRVIQIWDKEGTKLYTTLLTISDQQPEPKDDPVVLFRERPSGEPQAIKSWFYTGESNGYEFVYPKDQATKIAQANHESVLAQSGSVASNSDYATISKSQIGRVNESGQFEEQQKAASNNNEDNVASNRTPASQSTDQSSSSANRSAQTTTAADNDNATQDSQHNQSASTQAAPAPAPASQPSANRTEAGSSPSSAAANNSTADNTTANQAGTSNRSSVGTQNRTSANAQSGRSTGAQNRTSANAQSGTAANAGNNQNRTVGTSGQLPKTASNGPLMQLLAAFALGSGLGVRQLRKRAAAVRA